jgi:beta-ureidopropionase / N-carbamoyl-L-amino-acid hydrolase
MLASRRAFVGALTAAPLGLISQAPGPGPDLKIDAAALRARLEKLSEFGRPAGGAFADGVSRVAYSEADIAGRTYVIGLMRAAGLEPRIDPAGNIFARRDGREPSLPPILFGSHIDSVPRGGNFDGDLGSLAAISAIETLARADVRTRHPLEIVVWSAEEGVAFGRGLAGSRIAAAISIRPGTA